MISLSTPEICNHFLAEIIVYWVPGSYLDPLDMVNS